MKLLKLGLVSLIHFQTSTSVLDQSPTEKGNRVKLSTSQKMHLANVKTANTAWRTLKLESATLARLYVENLMATSLHSMDHAVRIAVEAGVPKRRIQLDGLQTTAPVTLYESLARTEGVAAALAVELRPDKVQRYRWHGHHELNGAPLLTVTMAGEDWDTFKHENKERSRNAAMWELNTGEFAFLGGTTVRYIGGGDSSTLNKIDQPVAAWVKLHGGDMEALAWILANPSPAAPINEGVNA